MDRDAKNKIVIVTGAAQGIGYQIAKHFLINGAKSILILDINEELGKNAARNLNIKYGNNKAYFIKCDVNADLKSVSEKIYEEFGIVDVLVNNAGVKEKDIDSVLDTNLKALIQWSFKYWELMRKDKGGKGGTIINVASAYGITAYAHYPVYHASKYGVIGFSKSLGHKFNYERTGVRVIALCPGFTKTGLRSGITTFDDEGLLESLKEFTKRKVSQDANVVGEAALKVFTNFDSGSVLLIRGGKLTVVED